MAKTFTLVILMLVALLGVQQSSAPPPDSPFENVDWRAKSKRPPSLGLKMGQFKLQLEETKLLQLQQAAKRGKIFSRGDASESLRWLCYTAENERLWAQSTEMGGGQFVTNISARAMEGVKPTAECPALPASLLPLKLDGGLWLGANQETVDKLLGPASHRKGPWRVYQYEDKVPGDCKPDGFDRFNWMFLKMEKGRVVEIQAGQVTAC